MTPAQCLLCGSTDAIDLMVYSEPDRYEMAAGVTADGYKRAWVNCGKCGFRYSRYSRDPEILDRLYDDAYRSVTTSWRSGTAEETFKRVIALPDAESETVERCRNLKACLQRLAAEGIHDMPARSPRRLLDVGGATGVFAYAFKDKEWETEIVDPGNQGRFIEGFGVPYHERRFDDGFDNGSYDLVSMIYMLEHVADPAAVLETARRNLSPDGLLYVEVPDEIAFQRKPAEDDIFNSCHLWMFGPDSLGRLLDRTGLDLLDLRRFRSRRGHFTLSVLARPAS